MKKRKALILVLNCIFFLSNAQENLVPDYSFEDTTSCPFISFDNHPSWFGTVSPDLYNKCANDVPVNKWGNYQEPKSGNGYVGIYTYFTSGAKVEYLQTKLTSQLKKGEQYYIEFYANPVYDYFKNYGCYINKIGLSFSEDIKNNTVDNVGYYTGLQPAVEFKGDFLSDTLSWTKISGCYTANGDENYVIIGNLQTASTTKYSIEGVRPELGFSAYVFIDEVGVYRFDPLPDTVLLCDGETIKLSAGFKNSTYKWNTGDTDSVLYLNKEGLYTVTATINGCEFKDSVWIADINNIQTNFDTVMCNDGVPILITLPVKGEYEWDNGETGRTILITEARSWHANVKTKCGSSSFTYNVTPRDCICNVIIPNAFTPNSDGLNDVFRVLVNCDYEYRVVRFQVYNRWGQVVHSAHGQNDYGWNGTINNNPTPVGSYFWLLEYEVFINGQKKSFSRKGDVILIR